ncbi:hypothetical protein GCM10011504_51580 [Siccirubricoccus deserti]|nr:hypothetical protein GCM10011504_51580 [Siccirubricoccus deserti]
MVGIVRRGFRPNDAERVFYRDGLGAVESFDAVDKGRASAQISAQFKITRALSIADDLLAM